MHNKPCGKGFEMLCNDALVKKAVLLKPEQTVEQALSVLGKAGVTFAPVLEDGCALAGVFSVGRLLENTLPVSVAVGAGDGGNVVNVMVPSAPGMAKRLQKYRNAKISEMMQRPVRTVHRDMPLEAAVRYIRETGEPAAVVDPDTGAYIGIVTETSILDALTKIAG